MPDVVLGGQAVVEGVMMRDKENLAVAVRKPNGRITVKNEKINSLTKRYKILKLPLLRGVVTLYETLVMGFKGLIFSAEESADDSEKISKKELILTFSFATIVAIAFFVLLPLFLASAATENFFLFNLIDGLLRIAVFLIYLLIISRLKDVQRMFAYHGAEHMTVHAHEHGKKLTVENVRKFGTLHPRCGTSFLLIVLVVSIIVFSLVTHPNFFVKFFSRLLLIPVIAGVSYELLKISAKFSDSIMGKIIVYPGITLQRITTRKPDKAQIEVAIAALKAVLKSSLPSSRR
ncbi:DUF1385 domain-containing protein [Candidatus Woesearchaeota archaeon]|nr:DUF1385 domain-containing protein [Candidatus Woesearchaeota archaeon]